MNGLIRHFSVKWGAEFPLSVPVLIAILEGASDLQYRSLI